MSTTPCNSNNHAALIEASAAAIGPPDGAATALARARQARLTKPPGSLGRLEELAVRIAGISGRERPCLANRLIVVAAADHGVAAQGVSAYPQEVTAQMVANFLSGGAAINVLADHAGARVRIVDAGVAAARQSHPELLRLDFGRSTDDITCGPAMSRETAERAIAAGVRLFEMERTNSGVDIVACGEMGIGNTTTAATLIAAVTGRPPATVTGRGTGVDDATFSTKLRVVETALAVNNPDPADGTGLLATVGGFEIGVLAGVYLAAAAARVPAVMDGVISGSAALVAAAIQPLVGHYLIAAHRSAEPGHEAIFAQLGLEPLFDLGLRLGEGSGAALGITLCVAACRLLDEMATFDEAGVTEADGALALES